MSETETEQAMTTTTTTTADAAAEAARLDAADPLRTKRAAFVLDDTVYLDGNSLGALPRGVPGRIAEVIGHEWGRLRIRSWTESGWWTAPERVGDRIAPLLGAAPGQVVVGDSTSVNVFKALVAAVRLAPEGRDEILVDATTFPTDGYIAASAARLTGRTLRPVPAGDIAAEAGPRTAAVLVNHVDYRTGALHDLPAITAAVRAAGALSVWDLCHSAGALPLALDADGVDLAVGCTYKYLNGGPGAPAYLYVRAAHQAAFDSPLPGWNSHAEPFAMSPRYRPAPGAPRGRVGTPEILSLLALEAALEVWNGVDLSEVRAKSLALTAFFERCLAGVLPVLTPAEPGRRGSQVALRCPDARRVTGELAARGVIADFREPDVLRFGFTPLYTSFAETERAARTLAEVLAGTPRRPAPAGAPDEGRDGEEAAALLARPPAPPDRTLRYRPGPDGVVDLYGDGDPRVVLVHGGWWRTGYDRAHLAPLAAALADRGVPVALVEYRRGPGAWPTAGEDLRAALAALPGTGPLTLAGHSAGGQLALWAAAGAPGRVARAVAVSPVADLREAARLGLGAGAVGACFGEPPAAADPLRLPAPPVPVTVLHGTEDGQVPLAQSLAYATRHGATLIPLPGIGHYAPVDPGTAAGARLLDVLSGG
ncbi:kynureninase [Streptomyces harbinensis]|uniref:Kynureninase n=1 Tax=Streptomyces harbinensis TaxID=1176198 RepID=A0A1I6SR48_9ACTN|nr:kynureninase [Streptomyces harbinensis]